MLSNTDHIASVSFPSSEVSPYPASNINHHANRSTHLPFRRISIPTAPSLIDRASIQSVVSRASIDDLPEEPQRPSPVSQVSFSRDATKKPKGRPVSMGNIGRRYSKRKEVRPVDDARQTKRLKIIHEFHDTEKAYVDGLDLIYTHFLTPVITSLDTPNPLLAREELTSVFSNFIDIWNLHRSFLSSFSSLLEPSSSLESLPPISPILLSHFPYLSLYSPFITSFPATISSVTSLLASNYRFSTFIAQQESKPECRRLKLRDWLLTIVQRCPRYLLLLKDLIGCTDESDPEHVQLMIAHGLVSKITVSLNASLYNHSQTLSLLALQRNTTNLPFQLVTPGRTFIKRGSLLQLERSSAPKEREFLLFSDYVIWLSNAEKGDGQSEDWNWGNKDRRKSLGMGVTRPPMPRTRSKSEAELSAILKAKEKDTDSSSSSGAVTPPPSKPAPVASPSKQTVQKPSNAADEKWIFKGQASLVDLEVVITSAREDGEERRLELMAPDGSFAVYAANERERDDWASAIRDAKSSLLASLNAMHPNSTLTSSVATTHLRRSLQALPHSPDEDHTKPKRGRVEHFVPAIWIPDGKTDGCMRCGKAFGWRRRRHHCRLCGRCVCASCSRRTFFISDAAVKSDSKPARACNACYDTVFPLLNPPSSVLEDSEASPAPSHSTLTTFPSWVSMPSFTVPISASTPDTLMALDTESSRRSSQHADDQAGSQASRRDDPFLGLDRTANASSPSSRMRMRPPVTRPRSYNQIVEDFRDQAPTAEDWRQGQSLSVSFSSVGTRSSVHEPEDLIHSLQEETENDEDADSNSATASQAPASPTKQTHTLVSERRESTARRRKRFSLPAVALQTTPVTARPNASGNAMSKSVSLVLNEGGHDPTEQSKTPNGEQGSSPEKAGLLYKGAAVKLSELLARHKE